jgi:hypothetical protein
VAAPPQVIFDLLADPRRHPELDGSGTITGHPTGPERLRLGARFGMSMRMSTVPYHITNTVVEFDEGRRIAWRHFYRHVWSWDLKPTEVDGLPGTEVTETFDWAPSLAPWVLEWVKFPAVNARGIEATLSRLQKRFATPTA